MQITLNNVILSLIITTVIYLIISTIRSYFKYVSFKNITNSLYEGSKSRSTSLGEEPCQLNGCTCKELISCDFEGFIDFIRKYINLYGTIHMIKSSKDMVFFNMLENHIINENCIVIGGTAIVPYSYIDYVQIVSYISSCDNIEYHINDDSKYSEPVENLYMDYVKSFLELKNIEEFNWIHDIISIPYSPELKNKKVIWRNTDTNTIYMHGYGNDPISMLVSIIYTINEDKSHNGIITKLNDIVDKFKKNTKLSLYSFIENDMHLSIDNVISSYSAEISDDIATSIEKSWMYNTYANSIWKFHEYTNSLMETVDE